MIRMRKVYCNSCGAQNIYSSNKPNFCQKCGGSFGSLQKKKTASPQQAAKASNKEDDIENFSAPDMEGLDFDIEGLDRPKDTLGAIMGTGGEDPAETYFGPDETKPISDKKFLEIFKKEAGSIRGGKGKKT